MLKLTSLLICSLKKAIVPVKPVAYEPQVRWGKTVCHSCHVCHGWLLSARRALMALSLSVQGWLGALLGNKLYFDFCRTAAVQSRPLSRLAPASLCAHCRLANWSKLTPPPATLSSTLLRSLSSRELPPSPTTARPQVRGLPCPKRSLRLQ